MAWNFANSPNAPYFPKRYFNQLDDYPTNHLYYVWNEGETVRFDFEAVPDTYELRSWKGELLQSGNCTLAMNMGVLGVGHYRLYFYKTGANDQYTKNYAGAIHIAIWRKKAGMMDRPNQNTEENALGALNITTLRLDPINNLDSIDDEIARALEQKNNFDAAYTANPDPARPPKNIVVHFADGTYEEGWEAGVKKVVDALGTDGIWYECRNEPDTNSSADTFFSELQQFYGYVKAANPNARVLGPNQVSINGGQYGWARRFFELGGGDYVDGYSFHAYNVCSGELDRGRYNAQRLVDLLTEFGQQNKPRWMTEWGAFATNYGSYIPMRQVRWLTMELLLWEQYGVPREHIFYFYLRSHGFWDYPSFITSDTYGFMPVATAFRVMAEETFGKAYAERLDFGDQDTDFIGSRYNAASGDLVALMASGPHGETVTFRVGGSVTSLEIIESMGASRTVTVTNGSVEIALLGEPLYVRLPHGTTFVPVTKKLGTNLVKLGMLPAVTASTGNTSVGRVWESPLPDDYPYWGDSPLPITITLKLGQMTSFDTVRIRGNQPWQVRSTILDGYVEVKTGSTWTRIGTIANNYTSFEFITGWRDTACYQESFFDEQFTWYFTAPQLLRSDEVRLVVTRATWGGEFAESMQHFPTGDGGQGMSEECLSLQGIEVYRVNTSSGSGGGTGSGPVSGRVIIRKP